MSTLVFDIQTIGERWDEIDSVTQNELTKHADRTARSEAERMSRRAVLRSELGLSPCTGFIGSVAVYDLERDQGAVYYCGDGTGREVTRQNVIFKERDEQTLLEDFWAGARSYTRFVTFRGRVFDVPFLVHRSIAHGVEPTRDLCRRRYLFQQQVPYHIDLFDELSFHNAMTRWSSLHMFCRLYDIPSPYSEVSGADITDLYYRGQYDTIAHHNVATVTATVALYHRWLAYLAPASFSGS